MVFHLVLDPDVFAYWHSSQADIRAASRLNFSEYKSATADKALESGRTGLILQLEPSSTNHSSRPGAMMPRHCSLSAPVSLCDQRDFMALSQQLSIAPLIAMQM